MGWSERERERERESKRVSERVSASESESESENEAKERDRKRRRLTSALRMAHKLHGLVKRHLLRHHFDCLLQLCIVSECCQPKSLQTLHAPCQKA